MALTKVRVAGLGLADDTTTITLEDTSSHSANTGPAISFKSKDSGGTTREVAKIVGESHSGSNEGNLAFQTRNGGTLETKWKIFKNGNWLPSNSSYGIYLGTTSAADRNLLDDYEEGTWTPSFANVSAPTFTSRTGRYTKIGNIVYLTCAINVASGLDTSDGSSVNIEGFPFSGNSTEESCQFTMGRVSNLIDNTAIVAVRFLGAGVILKNTAVNEFQYSSCATSGILQFSCTYAL